MTGRDVQSSPNNSDEHSLPPSLSLSDPFPPSPGTPGCNPKRQGKLQQLFLHERKKRKRPCLQDAGVLRARPRASRLGGPPHPVSTAPAPSPHRVWPVSSPRLAPPRDHPLPSFGPVPSETDPQPLDLICFSVCRVWGGSCLETRWSQVTSITSASSEGWG